MLQKKSWRIKTRSFKTSNPNIKLKFDNPVLISLYGTRIRTDIEINSNETFTSNQVNSNFIRLSNDTIFNNPDNFRSLATTEVVLSNYTLNETIYYVYIEYID
jgi:hypothetical protein